MLLVQLQKSALDNLRWDLLSADTDSGTFGTADINHKLHIAVYQLIIVGIFLEQQIIADIFLNQLSV